MARGIDNEGKKIKFAANLMGGGTFHKSLTLEEGDKMKSMVYRNTGGLKQEENF